ncbi:MAG TPA: serpin family protein [Puia sp.]|nr:serpin family protein [Puia sp.]
MSLHLRAGNLSSCLILSFALTLFSCHKQVSAPAVDTPLNLPPGSTAVTSSTNQFAFSLLHSILQHEPTGANELISPFSIYMALSMTYNGAAGPTRDSMAVALQQSGIPVSQLNTVSQALISQLPKEDSKVQLSVANAIWYAKNIAQPSSTFLNTIQQDYLGTMQSLDFTQPASVNTINTWVAKNTNNKIPAILDQVPSNTAMVLVNAVYFNGVWRNAFDPNQTRDMPFTLADGNTISTPFMTREMTIRANFGPSFAIAELPYSTGKGFNMYLVVPNDKNRSITDFAASFNLDTLTSAWARLDSTPVGLWIPKWEYAYSIPNLKTELTALGMGLAFGNADFSNMFSGESVNISQVAHKAYIKVSEEGTEAAAATGVVVRITASPVIPALFADHPFLYLITEKQTGTVLFIGFVTNPSVN